MNPIISVPMWVSLPDPVRAKIRILFNIPRSSNVVVFDGRVETDGTTHEDLKNLTTEKMQKYLHSESTDFHKLFDLVVAQVIESMQPIKQIVEATEGLQVNLETPKKRGRPVKNAKE